MRVLILLSLLLHGYFQAEAIDTYTFTFGSSSVNCCDRAFLGVSSERISPEKAAFLGFSNPYGSYVTKVFEGSAAHAAGLQALDYIVSVDNFDLTKDQSLVDVLYNFKPGQQAKITLIRRGNQMVLPVTFGKMGDVKTGISFQEKAFLGITNQGSPNDGQGGVRVHVVEASTAESMGLMNGDVVKAINGAKIYDWQDVTAALSNIRTGETIAVEFTRNGTLMRREGKAKSYLDGRLEKWEDWGEEQAEKWEIWGEQQAEKWEDWGERQAEKWAEKGEQFAERWSDDRMLYSKSAFLGVHIEKISSKKAEILGFDNPYGSYVSKVLKNTAAAKAGVQPFDYLYGLDEYRTGEDQSLGAILAKYQPGDEATLHFYRMGKKKSTRITLGSSSDVVDEPMKKCDQPFLGIRNDYEISRVEKGVQVNPVKNSTAQIMGILEGDKILEINGYTIVDWTDIRIAIENATPGSEIKVTVQKDGRTTTLKGILKTLGQTKECEEDLLGGFPENFKLDLDFLDENFQINKSPRNERLDWKDRPDVESMEVKIQEPSTEELTRLGSTGDSNSPVKIQNLKLSPNPSTGMFRLSCELPESGPTLVRVFNSAGRNIYEYDLGNFSGPFADEVDISQNGAGAYFLQIRQGEKTITRKLLVND